MIYHFVISNFPRAYWCLTHKSSRLEARNCASSGALEKVIGLICAKLPGGNFLGPSVYG